MLIGDRENDRLADRFSTTLPAEPISPLAETFIIWSIVHFTHSHLSRILQLADVYVWLRQFRNRNRDSQNERHSAVLDLLKRDHVDLFPAKYKEWPK